MLPVFLEIMELSVGTHSRFGSNREPIAHHRDRRSTLTRSNDHDERAGDHARAHPAPLARSMGPPLALPRVRGGGVVPAPGGPQVRRRGLPHALRIPVGRAPRAGPEPGRRRWIRGVGRDQQGSHRRARQAPHPRPPTAQGPRRRRAPQPRRCRHARRVHRPLRAQALRRNRVVSVDR